MHPASIQASYRFNTWANETIRQAMAGAAETDLRRPLELWFGSAFNILAHLCSGEAIWLARLRDQQTPARLLTAADFLDTRALIDTWRDLDAQWEAYVASLSAEQLAREITWQRQEGERFTLPLWQPVMHIPFHSSEHRGHATVALTQLGIRHGPQDFLYQFLPPPAVPRPLDRPPAGER